MLARLYLPGEHDLSRGVSSLPLLPAWFCHWHYLSHRHLWRESECEVSANHKDYTPDDYYVQSGELLQLYTKISSLKDEAEKIVNRKLGVSMSFRLEMNQTGCL